MELDDAFSTGSSIMPQKKNPDITELIRGKTGRVYGDLMTLLTMMKGLPLAYNKDMQEDKEALFDAVDTVKMCVSTFIPMLKSAKILSENMRHASAKGFINATDLADYLVKKGLPFRDAHMVSGRLVAYCIEKDTVLEQLSMEELKKHCDLFEEDVYHAISLDTCVKELLHLTFLFGNILFPNFPDFLLLLGRIAVMKCIFLFTHSSRPPVFRMCKHGT